MVNGIVTAVRGHKASVMTEDGTFRYVRGNYAVGQQVTLASEGSRFYRMGHTLAAAAAAVMIMVAGFGYYTVEVEAYSTVVIEGETPVTIYLNRKNKVVNVESGLSCNEEILEETRGMSLQDAMETLETTFEKEGYWQNTAPEEITVSVESADPAVQAVCEETMRDFTQKAAEDLKQEEVPAQTMPEEVPVQEETVMPETQAPEEAVPEPQQVFPEEQTPEMMPQDEQTQDRQ